MEAELVSATTVSIIAGDMFTSWDNRCDVVCRHGGCTSGSHLRLPVLVVVMYYIALCIAVLYAWCVCDRVTQQIKRKPNPNKKRNISRAVTITNSSTEKHEGEKQCIISECSELRHDSRHIVYLVGYVVLNFVLGRFPLPRNISPRRIFRSILPRLELY
jgi:hypothetical protein